MKTVVLKRAGIHSGNLILVNAAHPYKEGVAKQTLVSVSAAPHMVLLERQAAALLTKCIDELSGWNDICTISGWRSPQEQQALYAQSLKENGTLFTKKFVAPSGFSEHHTGLAIDLALKQENMAFICPHFPYTGVCQIFRQRSIPFGFIERYPTGKTGITGIVHEPWHFRYVGMPHADVMTKHGFTLEEYILFLKQHRYGENPYFYQTKSINIFISFLEAKRNVDTEIEIDNSFPYLISGNNIDGFIITQWREQNGRQ